MDQNKTGSFLRELRKEKQLTKQNTRCMSLQNTCDMI